MNYLLKITLEDVDYINENLEKLGKKPLKGKKDLIDFFIEINKIIGTVKIYNDVMLSVNEILQIIEDYKKYQEEYRNKEEPFIVEHDLPLFLENSELITEVMFVKKEEDSNEFFMVKADEVKGVPDKEIGELVLTVKINIKSENKFFISPEVNMVTYELDDDDENLMEDVDISDKDLEAQLDAESENLEDYADEEDAETEEDFDPELADDSILKDLMTNIIVSKIYTGGYEYPNEETIEELAEQLVNMINDHIENNLYKINYNAEEISDTEEDEKDVKRQLPSQPADNRHSVVQLKNDVDIEMFESNKKCYVITGINDEQQMTSMVFFESKMEDAIEAFKKSVIEMYPEKSLSFWQIKETLILDPGEIFGEEYNNED